MELGGGVAAVKTVVRRRVLVLVTPPPAAVTVTEKVPAGVELLVVIVNILEQFGLQAGEEKEPVASEGKPESEKEIGWVLPDDKIALMALATDEFVVTDRLPELERKKSKPATVPMTLNVKFALRVTPPPVAVTVIG